MINPTIAEKKGLRLIKGRSKKILSEILKIRNERVSIYKLKSNSIRFRLLSCIGPLYFPIILLSSHYFLISVPSLKGFLEENYQSLHVSPSFIVMSTTLKIT